ncbi:hypothetical protein FF38_01550 [Lucilia cuprina]|uniref:Regulatory protein zeste n=1 Tax=Lucilia cuprina TaxID=7375 RepID=A0A0L0CFG4_LUCCU|nr:hypothetical protein FF38_01550 [Lucilia cuprina]
MESHVDIARGYVKGDRVVKSALWADLAKKLNSCGPPTKDLNGWKKTWAGWKVYVKKKMSHNAGGYDKGSEASLNVRRRNFSTECCLLLSSITATIDTPGIIILTFSFYLYTFL